MKKYKIIAEKCLQYIPENIDHIENLNDFCKELNLNVNTTRIYFKKCYNISIYQYIIDCRVRNVLKLLSSTNDPMKVIALNSGFKDPNYLAYIFKKKYGITLTTFRNIAQVYFLFFSNEYSFNNLLSLINSIYESLLIIPVQSE
jgi:AraC-like DNA-binding protein